MNATTSNRNFTYKHSSGVKLAYSTVLEGWSWSCRNHSDQSQHAVMWCDCIQRIIKHAEDAEFYVPGTVLHVPIFPTAGLYASVHIEGEPADSDKPYAPVSMQYAPDFGSPITIPLGFWNRGDGMASLRAVVIDYMRTKLAPAEIFSPGAIYTRCPSSIHSFACDKTITTNCGSIFWKLGCLWNLVFEKACTPCVEGSTGGGNFGIDPASVGANRPGRPF